MNTKPQTIPGRKGKNDKLRIGVVGSGWVARMRHLPALTQNPHVNVTGIFSLNKIQAETLASKYTNMKVYDSLDDLIGSGINALVICTSPKTHAMIAKAALLAGLHVLCEKPMTVNDEDAKDLVQLAKEKNLILFPSHNFTFARAMTRAREIIDSGEAGEVLSVHGVQWSSWQRELPSWYEELPGGLFFDEGPHLLYLIQNFLGKCSIGEVSYTEKNNESFVYQQYQINIVGEKGFGHITALYGTPTSEWFITVICRNKTLVLDVFRDMCLVLPKEGDRTPLYLMKSIFLVEKQIWSQFYQWIVQRFTKGSHLFGLDVIVDKFVDATLYGQSPALSAEDGLNNTLLLNEIIRKSKQ